MPKLNKRPRATVGVLRCIICLMLLTFSSMKAISQQSPKISLSLKDVALSEAFKAIQRQTSYTFIYGESILSKANNVTINVQDRPLEDVLQNIFSNQPIAYRILGKRIVLRLKEAAKVNNISSSNDPGNRRVVTGKVTNEKAEPVEAATITVKGTERSTFTTKDGVFSIALEPNENALVISSVSMQTQEVNIGSNPAILVRLKERISELSDVTVTMNTGYEKLPKERATGSFEFIGTEELNRRPGGNILNRLDGVTTSVFFDKRTTTGGQNKPLLSSIMIRGISTLTSSPETVKQPLVIINNTPYEGDINNLNPNDVENITILKDAGASSIYGARAANGVIVITLKQGKHNQPLQVSLNTNLEITRKPDLFKLPRMTSSEFIDVETYLFNNGYYDGDLASTRFPALSSVIEILAKRRDKIISANDSASAINALRDTDVRNEFDKYIYRNAVSQQYFLNLSGGSDKMKYAVGLGYDNTQSILFGDNARRITANINNTFQPVEKLSFQLGIRYANTKSTTNSQGEFNDPRYGFRAFEKRMVPYLSFFNANGNYASLAQDYRTGYIDTAGGGKLLSWRYNPLQELQNANNKNATQDLTMNAAIAYNLIRGLQFIGNYQYQYSTGAQNYHYSSETYLARNLINSYTNLASTNPILRNPVPVGGILDQTNITQTFQFGRGQFSYSNSFEESKHEINALAGAEVKEYRLNTQADRLYGYSDSRYTSSAVDLVTKYPLYGNRGTASVPTGPTGVTGRTDRFVSLFANAAYTFDRRYTITASARRDAANLFGVDVNDKWNPFWSVGGSWNITRENFLSNLNLLSFLKIRGTYGFQGNVNNLLPPYTILEYVSAASNRTFNLPFANIRTPANPGLTWEKTKHTNIGLDYSFFKGRVTGTFDWYRKKGEDLILQAEVDNTTGISAISRNSASMMTKGIDFIIESWNIKSDFSWKTQLMYSHLKNKVLATMLDKQKGAVLGMVSQSGIYVSARKGVEPFSIYSLPFAGLDPTDGSPMGYLGKTFSKDYLKLLNQLNDTANVIHHGSALPTHFGNFNNTFSYKKLSLIVSISYKFGYYFRKTAMNYYALYQLGQQHPDFKNRWMKPGDEAFTNIPSMVYPLQNARRDQFYAYSSANVLKGDNIRLEAIRLSYDISNTINKKVPFRNIQVYAVIENIGLLWKENDAGLDPDYNIGSNIYLPPQRVTAGIKIDF